ncbi:hypothetical protein T484DRAFT_1757032 [Baffinella frigidus]|nr:hypothetical protein T484DRAFT_1757032 [Cryptophyta sp. CCMP2293]
MEKIDVLDACVKGVRSGHVDELAHVVHKYKTHHYNTRRVSFNMQHDGNLAVMRIARNCRVSLVDFNIKLPEDLRLKYHLCETILCFREETVTEPDYAWLEDTKSLKKTAVSCKAPIPKCKTLTPTRAPQCEQKMIQGQARRCSQIIWENLSLESSAVKPRSPNGWSWTERTSWLNDTLRKATIRTRVKMQHIMYE